MGLRKGLSLTIPAGLNYTIAGDFVQLAFLASLPFITRIFMTWWGGR